MRALMRAASTLVSTPWGGQSCPQPPLGGSRPRRKIIPRQLRDPTDGVFQGRAAAEMVGGEDAHHHAPRRAFQYSDVIADVGHEVAGLMRKAAVAFHVTRQTRAVNLAAHDL